MENLTRNVSFSHTKFHLHGFPGVLQYRYLIAIPLVFTYSVIFIGNGTIMYVICMKKALHSPMYILILLLCSQNLVHAMAFMPKFLLALVLEMDQVTLVGCLTQMFFMYVAGIYESNILLLMSLDRFVAIMIPLHYHHIISTKTLTLFILLGLLRSFLLASVIIGFASGVQFCGSNIILNFSCENMSLLSLGCGDLTTVHAVGLWVRILLTGFDATIISISYFTILHTIMKLVVGKAREKAWQTCSAHLLAAMLTYVSGVSCSIVYRIGSAILIDVQNMVSLISYAVPGVGDPFIYGIKMKEIRDTLRKTFTRNSEIDLTTGQS
ncbi:olfactory receptor 52L1-like [Hyperolius riggenbachi]|uniref:olfactory receptor 52L1-like n=1 Tax=Hyperolius riggenbachi TaxID=752182 RepID=UPI0035A38E61